MEERQLDLLFRQFLIQKGYPKESLLSQVSLRSSGPASYSPDLVIFDFENKEYIGLIEFKNRIDKRIEKLTVEQFKRYFDLLGSQKFPAYLVYPIDDFEFQILELNKDNGFFPIVKDDFPNFESLSAKKMTEEKLEKKELEARTLKELDAKKNRARKSAFLSILSLLIGITASIIAIVTQQKGFFSTDRQQFVCCDSLEVKYQELHLKILNLEIEINTLSNLKGKTDTIYFGTNLTKLENRLAIIENGISEKPEKTLSIMQIRQDIELLKKEDEYTKDITKSKIDALKNEMDIQNAWMLGVLIAIFGTILSIAIPNLMTKKN
jgi:hypothetical protein